MLLREFETLLEFDYVARLGAIGDWGYDKASGKWYSILKTPGGRPKTGQATTNASFVDNLNARLPANLKPVAAPTPNPAQLSPATANATGAATKPTAGAATRIGNVAPKEIGNVATTMAHQATVGALGAFYAGLRGKGIPNRTKISLPVPGKPKTNIVKPNTPDGIKKYLTGLLSIYFTDYSAAQQKNIYLYLNQLYNVGLKKQPMTIETIEDELQKIEGQPFSQANNIAEISDILFNYVYLVAAR